MKFRADNYTLLQINIISPHEKMSIEQSDAIFVNSLKVDIIPSYHAPK